MSISVYLKTDERRSLSDWAPGGSEQTEDTVVSEMVTLAGKQAVVRHFETSYLIDEVVVEDGDIFYSFAVMYGDPNAALRTDFYKVLSTVKF